MYANTLGSEFTRYREGNNQSSYRNLTNAVNIVEELRFAHSDAGKFGDAPLKRHLVSYEITVQPTAANGLKKPQKCTVNLTITHTDEVPVAVGTGDFAHLSVNHALNNICQTVFATAWGGTYTGNVSTTSIVNGEV